MWLRREVENGSGSTILVRGISELIVRAYLETQPKREKNTASVQKVSCNAIKKFQCERVQEYNKSKD